MSREFLDHEVKLLALPVQGNGRVLAYAGMSLYDINRSGP